MGKSLIPGDKDKFLKGLSTRAAPLSDVLNAALGMDLMGLRRQIRRYHSGEARPKFLDPEGLLKPAA